MTYHKNMHQLDKGLLNVTNKERKLTTEIIVSILSFRYQR